MFCYEQYRSVLIVTVKITLISRDWLWLSTYRYAHFVGLVITPSRFSCKKYSVCIRRKVLPRSCGYKRTLVCFGFTICTGTTQELRTREFYSGVGFIKQGNSRYCTPRSTAYLYRQIHQGRCVLEQQVKLSIQQSTRCSKTQRPRWICLFCELFG